MIYSNNYTITTNEFPCGESKIEINPKDSYSNSCTEIFFIYEKEVEILHLLHIVDYLRNEDFNMSLRLVLHYVPYCRQDRHFKNEAFTLKTFCKLINSCNFEKVQIKNPHSDVTTALINNVENLYDPYYFFENFLQENKFHILSPDSGAFKKTYKIYLDLKKKNKKCFDFIECKKVRCLKTGNIVKTEILNIPDDNYPIVIIDDICEGGTTFYEIAKILKNQDKSRPIILYVSHGFFTKGLEVFDGLIDKIFIDGKGYIKEC